MQKPPVFGDPPVEFSQTIVRSSCDRHRHRTIAADIPIHQCWHRRSISSSSFLSIANTFRHSVKWGAYDTRIIHKISRQYFGENDTSLCYDTTCMRVWTNNWKRIGLHAFFTERISHRSIDNLQDLPFRWSVSGVWFDWHSPSQSSFSSSIVAENTKIMRFSQNFK